jgi:hypothetical protein
VIGPSIAVTVRVGAGVGTMMFGALVVTAVVGVARSAYGSIGRMSPDGPAANARGGDSAAASALELDAITFAGAVSFPRRGATSQRVAA